MMHSFRYQLTYRISSKHRYCTFSAVQHWFKVRFQYEMKHRYCEQSIRDIIHLARVAAWKQTQHFENFCGAFINKKITT